MQSQPNKQPKMALGQQSTALSNSPRLLTHKAEDLAVPANIAQEVAKVLTPMINEAVDKAVSQGIQHTK